ncbi:Tim44 domain-containing protein [Marivibrio halodurans]|uniref:Tim44 domain-containing protein n=1 Tax=Marivibrio halodurans TaxID=2039722 RepID=A0A8J7S0P2_9PROT|nr:Tim44/TimA family putative adaptor protein [Marivibrio halodurans]MBP5858170.1 Tim44 domain-containing protein [Marivibrio halodurans]
MGGGFPLDLILFAALALFLIFRLGSVLGKRTGHQKPTDLFRDRQSEGARDRSGEREDAEDENVIRMPGARQPERADGARDSSDEFTGKAGSGLTQIKVADPDFDPDGFLDGARQAFEMIVQAFAEGEGKTLKQLLSKEVYENFAGAIREREKAGQRMEDTLYGIDSAEIVEAGMQGSTASVTVEFVSQQINVTYDSEGRVIAGDPSEVVTVTDIWTFQRNVKSRDPNWELAETSSPDEESGDDDAQGTAGGKSTGGPSDAT